MIPVPSHRNEWQKNITLIVVPTLEEQRNEIPATIVTKIIMIIIVSENRSRRVRRSQAVWRCVMPDIEHNMNQMLTSALNFVFSAQKHASHSVLFYILMFFFLNIFAAVFAKQKTITLRDKQFIGHRKQFLRLHRLPLMANSFSTLIIVHALQL